MDSFVRDFGIKTRQITDISYDVCLELNKVIKKIIKRIQRQTNPQKNK